MPRWLQVILHVLANGVGAYLAYTTGTPLPAIVAGGTSGVIGAIAQSYNTDGTPQSVPFQRATNSPINTVKQ
jgi:hypothetical protein